MSALKVVVEECEPGIVIFKLSGALDGQGAVVLSDARERHVPVGTKRLAVSLADVSFISSSGIGTLIMLSEDLEQAGGMAILAELSPEVKTVFEILDLDDVMWTSPTFDDAIERLRAA